jgi:predicted aspartyl protease
MATVRCGFDDSPGVKGCDLLVFFGPTLLVQIGFDPTYDPTVTGTAPVKAAIPNLPPDALHALVDTGATESCIDSDLAMRLNLPVVDRRQVAGVHGALEVNVHLAHVHIPSLNYTIHGAFSGVNLAAGGQAHRALIGRTFLQNFTMVYEGRTGTVTLTQAFS